MTEAMPLADACKLTGCPASVAKRAIERGELQTVGALVRVSDLNRVWQIARTNRERARRLAT